MARPKTTTHVEVADRLHIGVRTVLRWSAGSAPKDMPVRLRKLPSGRLALTDQDWQRLTEWVALRRQDKRDVIQETGPVACRGQQEVMAEQPEWQRRVREERAMELLSRPADVATIRGYLRATGSRKTVYDVVTDLAARPKAKRAAVLAEYRRHLARLTPASRRP